MKLVVLVLLLSVFSSLTLTEVVQNFNRWNCGEFFMKKPGTGDDRIIPTIFKGHQYKKICQRWKNRYRFATVYDTERRIPVYSAYTFTQKETISITIRNDEWKIEPQLEEQIKGYKDIKEMMDSPREAGNITHQAVNSDYMNMVINNITYTRGHVFPHAYAGNQNQADSTFTLTNIAPQSNDNNRKWERQVETPMLRNITNICKLDKDYPAYIVTGVVPGDNWLNFERNNKIIKNRINIPRYFWSAFCCKDRNGRLVSGTYIAEQGGTVQKFKPRHPRHPSIDNLNKRLTKLYCQNFEVFPGLNCLRKNVIINVKV